MRVLFVCADVGGARALEPLLPETRRRGCEALPVDHGFWKGRFTEAISEHDAVRLVDSKNIELFAFSTSLSDTFPLTLARRCRQRGIPVFCMLDSWLNYRLRLECDGKGLFLPDIYAVMDDAAFAEALDEGIPESILAVTGQPSFASLPLKAYSPSTQCDGRGVVLFVSEPVEMDQGGDSTRPGYRGYTESDVFPLFCRALQPYAGSLFLLTAPHPREDPSVLKALWEEYKGDLHGRVLFPGEGRESAFSAYAVAGMASVLLYESWLLGIPVLSIQPGLLRKDFGYILRQPGVVGAVHDDALPDAVERWLRIPDSARQPRSELERHRRAASRCADLLVSVMEGKALRSLPAEQVFDEMEGSHK